MDPIFQISSDEEFRMLALKTFSKQYSHVTVYRKFVDYLGVNPADVDSIEKIPFMPVEFFRNHRIIDSRKGEHLIFYSSGTTSDAKSKHFVADPDLYEQSFVRTFTRFYGKPDEYCILAALPSYLERKGSSLVYMTSYLINKSGHEESGFFLRDYERLILKLLKLKERGQKTLLLGVSFAFLEFAARYREDLQEVIFMETGGMKGHGRELTRAELHATLKKAFNLDRIHSEYGMTELLSQAYSLGEGRFQTPPWMKVLIRDSRDPMELLEHGKTGAINIIDLANRYSCSFLATSDLGKVDSDGSFEVLGRMDQSEIRGCNLLI